MKERKGQAPFSINNTLYLPYPKTNTNRLSKKGANLKGNNIIRQIQQ